MLTGFAVYCIRFFTYWFDWQRVTILLKKKINWGAFRSFLKSNAFVFQKANNYPGIEIEFKLMLIWLIKQNQSSFQGHLSLFNSARVWNKAEEYSGNEVEVGSDVSIQTRLSQMIGKSCKYISDLTLLPRRIEILRDKMIGIRYPNFHFITGLVHSFHFYKVCLAMFGPRTLDCIVEPKQTSEDALKSGKNELVVSIINLVPLSQERIRLLAYVEYFMLI